MCHVEFFSTVPAWNFDMCMISTRTKTHLPLRLYVPHFKVIHHSCTNFIPSFTPTYRPGGGTEPQVRDFTPWHQETLNMARKRGLAINFEFLFVRNCCFGEFFALFSPQIVVWLTTSVNLLFEQLAFLTPCDQAFNPPFLGGKIIELAKFCFKNKRFEPSLSFFSKQVIVSHCV